MDRNRGGVMAVGGVSKSLTYSPVINTSIYASGDTMGTDAALANAFRLAGGTALLQSLLVIDKANQSAAFNVVLFSADPAGTFTNNAAFPTLSAADASLIVARIPVLAADYVTTGGCATAHLTGLGRVLEAASGATSLWCALVTTGTPTYGSATDLVLRFGLLQD